MSFLVVLICCAVELAVGAATELRDVAWIRYWRDWLLRRFGGAGWWSGMTATLVTVGGPVLVVGFVGHWFANWAMFLAFIFSIVVCLYCMGPGDLNLDVERFLRVTGGDARRDAADELLASMDATSGTPDTLVARGVLIEAHDRVFAPLFWFVLLGPAGAVLFRSAAELRHEADIDDERSAAAAQALYQILIWIPARLMALGFGLAGSLTHSLDAWRDSDTLELASSQTVLASVGIAAIPGTVDPASPDAENDYCRAARGLVNRTIIVWLVLLGGMALL